MVAPGTLSQRGWAFAAAIVAMTLYGQSRNERKKMEPNVIDSIETTGGTLEIIETGQYSYKLVLAGKVLASERAETLDIAASFPETGTPTLVVLEIGSGGSSCPAMYKVVSAPASLPAQITQAFGTCSDEPELSFRNGVLRMEFPQYLEARPEVWLYDSNRRALVREK